MENRSHPSDQAPTEKLALYLDESILSDLSPTEIPEQFELSAQPEAKLSFMKKGQRLWVNFPDGEFCDYPYYLKNVRTLLQGFRPLVISEPSQETFDSVLKTTQSMERKLFSNLNQSGDLEKKMKDEWDEIIKKINLISNETQSLRTLTEKLLDLPFLQNFQTSLLILHLKGQTKAEIMGTMWREEKVQSFIEVKDFNLFFNSTKKSKIKSFTTELFPKVNLPFNGSFLAKEVSSMKYSLIAIASRHDFLSYSREEIELFETCIDLIQPHFERLVDQEFSDKRISELRICLKDFPLPLRIKNSHTGATFQNDLYRNELQDQDIFFNKKVQGPFNLDLYDSDELRHYAFDLFHFQRISLLGELLNTLRHELSNPLFGLKLSSQIFTTLDVSRDCKEMMQEIEKNVNRCQVIIENFSSLYQLQNESKPVSVKKIIDEALTLSKSEARELKKNIVFGAGTEDLELNTPLIFVVQIIFNLIVNSAQAVKQTTERGELFIDVNINGEQVSIDVGDNGAGIPEDKLTQLFKPFFTTKSQGTGLGLVLSRNLALKMGGNLEYLDNNKTKGALFRLTLPIK